MRASGGRLSDDTASTNGGGGGHSGSWAAAADAPRPQWPEDGEKVIDDVAYVCLMLIGWDKGILGGPHRPLVPPHRIPKIMENRSAASELTTWRDFALMLNAAVSPADRVQLGAALMGSGVRDLAGGPAGGEFLRLLEGEWPALDRGPTATATVFPYGITPSDAASQLKKLHAARRTEAGIKKEKRTPSRLGEQLGVWDAVEGWEYGVYRPETGRSFAEINRVLQLPGRAVEDHYKAGFKLVTGFDFSAELWERLFFDPLMRIPPELTGTEFHPALHRRLEKVRANGRKGTGTGIARRSSGTLDVDHLVNTRAPSSQRQTDPTRDVPEIDPVLAANLASQLRGAADEEERDEIVSRWWTSPGPRPAATAVLKKLEETAATVDEAASEVDHGNDRRSG